jgi:hypothetical protein
MDEIDFQLLDSFVRDMDTFLGSDSTSEEGDLTSIEDEQPEAESAASTRLRLGREAYVIKRRQKREAYLALKRKQRPRIMKNDFRRNYADMWATLFNDADPDLLSSHIEKFYHPDLVFSQTDRIHYAAGMSPPLSKPTTQGRHFLQNFWKHMQVRTPDLVCAVKHAVVKVRPDGTSSIRFSFEINGTQLVSAVSEDVDSCCAPPKSVQGGQEHTNPNTDLDLDEDDWDHLAILLDEEQVELLNAPNASIPSAKDFQKFACLGSFELQLDSSSCICAIHLTKTSYTPYPTLSQ